MSTLTIILTSTAISQATVVAAEEPQSSVRYAVETHYTETDFTGLRLEGHLVRPSGLVSMVVTRPGFHPLFQLRRDFALEIEESPSLLNTPSAS
jgi:hypothetical protein